MYQGFKTYKKKTYFTIVIRETESYMYNKSCCDVCAPRVLCHVTLGSFKHGLKNFTKLQQ